MEVAAVVGDVRIDKSNYPDVLPTWYAWIRLQLGALQQQPNR
jgi:hypothetical protein